MTSPEAPAHRPPEASRHPEFPDRPPESNRLPGVSDDQPPQASRLPEVAADQFFAIDIRVATVIACEPFQGARRPAYWLDLDVGPLGMVRSSARLTDTYLPHDLVGRQVLCVVNLPARQIGPHRSQVLVLGVYQEGSERVVLISPERPCSNGDRVG